MNIPSLSSIVRPVVGFAKNATQNARAVLLLSALALAVIIGLGLLFAFVFSNHFKDKSPVQAEQKDPHLQQFIGKMESSMRNHLQPYQKATLINLYHQAMKTDNPRKAMDVLISQKINVSDGWGKEKAEQHIKRHLLDLLPSGKMKSVKEIAEKTINSQGDRLVCFYKKGETEFLGNFADCPSGIKVWGKTFRCSEAAFQWRKFLLAANENKRMDMLNDPKMNEFFDCTGEEAFELKKYFDDRYPQVFVSGWLNGQRDQVMWAILKAKFDQNKEFAKLLQDTSGAYLLEHNPVKGRDAYWSDDHDGNGCNMLGKMLMAIRDRQQRPYSNVKNDPDKVKAFAAYANQPGALPYQIF